MATTGRGADDAELVRRALLGEYPAWRDIVDRHLPMVNAIARSYRLSTPDREDVVQTVWLTLNQHLPRLREPRHLKAWLSRVTRDKCLRQRERDARQYPTDPEAFAHIGGAAPDPETEYLRKERDATLRRAVDGLRDPDERRAALRYLEPESVPRAEDPRVASNHRRRMVRRLRDSLEDV
ncbi:sigma-70 family RNA polymerase sigma factor [Nocardiopsis sp. N85]|uniref:RNA polymerase sigma factor n=1 Tax=Nocardiopsis sp. N85 TaxID=3029400 RepID=UPI00237F2A9E|nr:sigma-70 family RNA polymerase sigma factor [Nocardiopsis sp. N85]MDE3722633.1 sigma-70 family RNA polymerase sigma factor [Nocardiopsis sp. N85]